MNRKKHSKSSSSEVSSPGRNEELPPTGRGLTVTPFDMDQSEPAATGSLGSGVGERKKKFSFFSNLFKSRGESSGSTKSEGRENNNGKVKEKECLNSSSSFESVNSATTTNSFTFVSSKKFLKGKGHKGKRIPVDDPTLPRPHSSNSTVEVISNGSSNASNAGLHNGNGSATPHSRPGSIAEGNTGESRTRPQKKLGTLSRIGVKIGLKKKYNLQSCESLEHIGSTLPRQGEKPLVLVSPKKGKGKKAGKSENGVQASNGGISSPANENDRNENLVQSTTVVVEIVPSNEPSDNPPPSTSSETRKEDVTIAKKDSIEPGTSKENEKPVITLESSEKANSPGPSNTSLALSPYTNDCNTWSSSTGRRNKRRAPPPPSVVTAGPSKSVGITRVPSMKGRRKDAEGNNVELKSVKRLQDPDVLGNGGGNNTNTNGYPSYPCGALRRQKEKTHLRPYSCSCTNSIFAHHSKYQQYHKRWCSNEKNESKVEDSTTDGDDGMGYNTRTRSHVRGKKKAPPPPNPFDTPEASGETSSAPTSSAPQRKTKNPENPYGNPFLDDDDSSKSPVKEVVKNDRKEGSKTTPSLPQPSPSTSASILSQTEVNAGPSSQSQNATTMLNSITVANHNAAVPESPEFHDEIAQNILNDQQEQDQRSGSDIQLNSTAESSVLPSSLLSQAITASDRVSTSAGIPAYSGTRSQPTARTDRSQSEMESLLKSSPTLLAQARSVDNQVKARLSENKKGKGEALSSSLGKSNDNNPPSGSTSPSLSPPLSPTSPNASGENKSSNPKPWYKRGIYSSKSQSSFNKSRSPTAKPISTVNLPKFSDLDREAQKIVEENKRRSAEIAFNQNAKDLINIFNTAFTVSVTSPTPSIVESRVNGEGQTSIVLSTSTVTPIITSAPTARTSEASMSTNTSQNAVTPVITPSSSKLSSVTPTSNCLTTTPKSTSNTTCSGIGGIEKVSVSQSQRITPIASSSINVVTSATVTSSPCSSSSSVITSISKSTPCSTMVSSINGVTTSSSSPVKSAAVTTVTAANHVPRTSVSALGEVWTCPRCTLKNSGWRALCEACFFRKFSPPIIGSNGTKPNNSPTASAVNTPPTTKGNGERIVTTSSSSTSQPSNSIVPSDSSAPNAKVSSSTNASSTKPELNHMPEPVKLKPSENENEERNRTPPNENFMSQHLEKSDHLKDEKLQGMRLNSTIDRNLGDGHTPTSEVDIEALRQVRVAFFAKEQIPLPEKNASQNQNVTQTLPEPQQEKKPLNNLTFDKTPSSKSFHDGEDNSIDEMLMPHQKAPARPPKPANMSRNPEPIYAEIGPDLESLLPIQQSFPLPANQDIISGLRYRSNLDPICETYDRVMRGQRVRIYENWEQQQTPPFANSNVLMSPMFMPQNIAIAMPDTNIPGPTPTFANFRTFANPNPGSGFDPGSAFQSASHFLSSGFTSESDTEVDSEMERHRRSGGRNRERDNRHSYFDERHLSYDDYKRLGAVPKGYNYNNYPENDRRQVSGASSSDSGRRRHFYNHSDSGRGMGVDGYISESSEGSIMANNPQTVSKLLQKLEWAITNGEHRLAATLAHDLALIKANCIVANTNADPITIRVYVEDRFLQQGPFLVQVLPTMTLKDLKSKIEGDWGIPSGFQKWILGKKIAEEDNETLSSYEVVHDTMSFLYLVTPQIENLGISMRENMSPPPLPKKPASPIPKSPSFGIGRDGACGRSVSSPVPQKCEAAVQVNKKSSSGVQTENSSPIRMKKPPMPDPVESDEQKPGSSKVLNDFSTKEVKEMSKEPIASSSTSQIKLYERPKSPNKGACVTKPPEKVMTEKTISANDQGTPPLKPKQSELSKLSSKSHVQRIGSTPVSPTPTSNSSSKSPVQAPTQSFTTTPANHAPLSLQAKLANLRQAAEQAFGKSFAQQTQQGQQLNMKTANAETSANINPTKEDKPLNTHKSIPEQMRASPSAIEANVKVSKPPPLQRLLGHADEPSLSKDQKQTQPQPGPSKPSNKASKPNSTPIDPVPRPRIKKPIQQPAPRASSEEKILNTSTKLEVNISQTEKKLVEQSKEKVEGSCQTTLPFPGRVSKSSDAGNLSTSPPPTSPSPTPPHPQSPSGDNRKTQGSTVIVANVLVTPMINHALLGNSAFLQKALGYNYPSFPPQAREDTIETEIIVRKNDNHATFDSSSTKQSHDFPSETPSIAALMKPLTLPDLSSANKPYHPPIFIKKEDEIKANKPRRQSVPSTKVKMMAEKFNSTTVNGKAEKSSNNFLQRKFSDSSIMKSAISTDKMKTSSSEGQETYLKMLEMMEKQDIILNSDPFDCPVCFLPVPSNEGVTLRECLHNFCKDCLIGAVQYAEESEVKCPYRDDKYSCSSTIQEREIKALVPREIFEQYLTRSVKLAEMKMMNSFHCKTADCPGWCIFEDDVNIFKCPLCKKRNCITCAAIHEEQNCQQYQRHLAILAETDEDAKSSRLMLEQLIEQGNALECPACHVVLLKKWGCDWVRCTYCKSEICWVTKGLRWGPGGKGDITGGCRCGVNGVKCHPKCTFCH